MINANLLPEVHEATARIEKMLAEKEDLKADAWGNLVERVGDVIKCVQIAREQCRDCEQLTTAMEELTTIYAIVYGQWKLLDTGGPGS